MLRKPDFANRLLAWYDQEARVLPWRSNPTPYRVWISEMMLQQTRVETVIPYFLRFVNEIPDITSLAAIDEDKLLKLWQGLGYYSRALNLKKAAILLYLLTANHFKNFRGSDPTQPVLFLPLLSNRLKR
jgi:A/G-specific adenine glycosylase